MTVALTLAWLRTNWRLVALGASLAAVVGFVGLSLRWHGEALQAKAALVQMKKERDDCRKQSAALTEQIKKAATEEGKRYETTEAQHLASCHDAYVAGAKRLRDDQAVASGRYVPRSGASVPKR